MILYIKKLYPNLRFGGKNEIFNLEIQLFQWKWEWRYGRNLKIHLWDNRRVYPSTIYLRNELLHFNLILLEEVSWIIKKGY